MNLKTTAVFAVIALMLTAGAAAAMPGSAPDHAADDENDVPDDQPPEQADGNATAADGHADENESAHADDAMTESAAGGPAAAAGERGPPQSLPEQVPDHVSSIHDLIRTFLQGDGDGNLGEQISDVTPDDDEADGNATATPDGNATATPTA